MTEQETSLIPSESVCKALERAARAERRAEKALNDARKALAEEARNAGHHGIFQNSVSAYLREDRETGIAQAVFRNHSARQAESLIRGRIACEEGIAARGIRAA